MSAKWMKAFVKHAELKGRTLILDLMSFTEEWLPKFEAGSHIDIRVNKQIVRSYSLCSDPAKHEIYRLAILLEENSRGGSKGLHESIYPGGTVEITEPKNNFPIPEGTKRAILVGGGIGVTPMMAMAYDLQSRDVPFTLFYCGSNREEMAFIDKLPKCEFGENVKLRISSEDTGRFSCKADLPTPDEGLHVFVCGPQSLMDAVLKDAVDLGHASSNVHKEDFGADVDLSGAGFEVYAQQSDKTINVGDGETIAKALEAAGISVDVSCEEGICGTCMMDCLEGEIDHRDEYLNDEEKESGELIMVCCSRAKTSRLVLDI